MNRLDSLKKRKREILRRIEFTEERKKEALKRLDKETAEKWLDYYDKYINIYKKHLEVCESEIKKQKPYQQKAVYILIFLILIVSILILISIFPVIKPLSLKISEIGGKIPVILEKIITPEVKEAEKIPEKPEVEIKKEAEKFEEPKVPVSLEDKTIQISEESLLQYQAVVGKSVKWKKQFTIEQVTGFTIELPKGSENISVKKVIEGKTEDITDIVSISKKRNLLIFGEKSIEVEVSTEGITGMAVGGENQEKVSYEVEYETPAPKIEEEEINNSRFIKRVKITGPDDVHYKNILSFTELPREMSKSELGKLKLYEIKNRNREAVKFTAYDTDENGLYDYIEWLTPELSEAEFLLIIEISKAEHLDSNKNFIFDIYEQVKALDDIWSETINENEYVRVNFSRKLDNTRDITLYPRVISGEPKIEVYEVDGSEKIAEFTNIKSNEYNKVYLTELQGQQDVFDLKMVGGSLQLDYIVDPTYPTYMAIWIPTYARHSDGSDVTDKVNATDGITVDVNEGPEYVQVNSWNDSLASDEILDYVLIFVNVTYVNRGPRTEIFTNHSTGDGSFEICWVLGAPLPTCSSTNTVETFWCNMTAQCDINTNEELNSLNIRSRVYQFSGGGTAETKEDAIWLEVYYHLSAPIVGVPETYNNLTLTKKTEFFSDDKMFVNVSVTHEQEASKLDSVLISIFNSSGGIIVNNASMIKSSSITNGYVYNYSWLVISNADLGKWTIEVCANDTNNNWDCNSADFSVLKYGWLNVTLLNPEVPGPTYVIQNTLFVVNATITCEGDVGVVCGDIFGLARYNKTTDKPDAGISIIEGAVPFYIKVDKLTNEEIYTTSGLSNPSYTTNVTIGNSGSLGNGGSSLYYTGSEITTAEYSALETADNNRVSISGDGLPDSLFLRAHFKTNRSDYDEVINITFRSEGYSNQGYTNLWVRNISSNSWIQVSTGTSTGADNVLEWSIESGVDDYFDDEDYIHFKFSVNCGAAPCYLYVDFINLTVNYSQGVALNPIPLGELNYGDLYKVNWTINATGDIGSIYKIDVLFNSSYGNVNVPDNDTEDAIVRIVGEGEIFECMDLTEANKTYTLGNDVNTLDTCFNITAQNITLDCKGYEINYSSDGGNDEYGVNVLGYNFTTIKNCVIKEGLASGDYDHAIYFNKAKNGTIENNTITTSGMNSYGIYLYSSSNSNTLSNNTVTTLGGSGKGIYLHSSSNSNTVSNNMIITSEGDGYGIRLELNSNNNQLNNNTIITSGNNGYGIRLVSSSINNILNNKITTSKDYSHGAYLTPSSNNNQLNNNIIITSGNTASGIVLASNSNSNTLSNNTITTSGGSGYGIYLQTSSTNNSFSGMNIKTNNTNGYSIYIYDTNHNFTIKDSILNSSKAGVQEFYVRNAVTGGNWNFTNVTRANGNPINISWSAGAKGKLNMMWYYQANITYNNVGVANANLSAYNKTGIPNGWQFNLTSKADGLTNRTTIIDYVIIDEVRDYYSLYTINTTNGSLFEQHQLNVTWRTEQSDFGGLIFENIVLKKETDVAECRNLTKANTVYSLTKNLIGGEVVPVSSKGCIDIQAQNITFDCGGFAIKNSSLATAGVYSNSSYTTIKNCNISMKRASNGGSGIYLEGANNSYIFNSTLNSNRYGIYIKLGSNNRIINAVINDNYNYGIYLKYGSNNTIVNNTLNNNRLDGMYLEYNSDSIITNNSIDNSISLGDGIYIGSSSNNILTRNIFNSGSIGIILIYGSSNNILISNIANDNVYGIYFDSGSNNIIKDGNISENTYADVYLVGNSMNDTFLNVSYNISKEEVYNSELIRKWYYQANISYNNVGVDNANLSAYNKTGIPAGWQFNLTSNSSGFTNITTITDYINNGGTRNYYSNYTINTNNISLSESHQLNVTEKSLAGNFGGLIFENIMLGGKAPQIIWVQNLGNVMPDSGSLKNVSFNFTVYDVNEFSDLNESSAKANFTRGSVVRNSTNCSRIVAESSGNYANYSCTVGMWYFDNSGNWNITVAIADNSQNWAINDSAWFNYEEAGAFDIFPKYINWTSVELGGLDKPADNNMSIRNLGNKNIFNITINATQLNGTQYTEYNITADKFRVNVSSSEFCNGYSLLESQNVTFSLFINYSESSENFPANKSLGFCLETLTNIPAQVYKSARDWLIEVEFFVLALIKTSEIVLAVAVSFKRKKKKKDGEDKGGLGAKEKLKDKYIDFDSLLDLDERLREKYGLGAEEILKIAKKEKVEEVEEKIEVPLNIFKQELGPAEALCKYLKENLQLRFSEIAELLNRDERTIWINYRNAAKKKKEKIKTEKKMLISVEVFSDRRLSVLESVVKHLKEKGLRNIEIAKLLGKDQRNIYTLYSRAKKKLS